MTVLIAVPLLLFVAFRAYRTVRAVRSLDSDASTGNPVLRRLASMEHLQQVDAPDTIAAAREGELTRQLLSGALDAASYRLELGELAQRSASRAPNL